MHYVGKCLRLNMRIQFTLISSISQLVSSAFVRDKVAEFDA